MPVLYLRDENGNFVPIKATKGADGKSAYESAVEGGFGGTYEEFCQAIAELTPNAELTPYAKHFNDKSNPHGVTANQTGAIPSAYSKSDDLDTELTAGGNKMIVCCYHSTTKNTPHSEGLTDYAHGMVITNAHTDTHGQQYGTQLCLPSGDNSVYLRRYNKQGKTEWGKISYEDIATQFDNTVKKTGDTMTGAMTVKKDTAWGQYSVEIDGCYRSFEADNQRLRLDVRDAAGEGSANNRRFLDIYSNIGTEDFNNAIKIAQVINGVTTTATLLHTKNKPSGTYTGNEETREIYVGGIGKYLLISGTISSVGYLGIIHESGGVIMAASNASTGHVYYYNTGLIKFQDGELYISTDSNFFNSDKVVYTYQVL